METRYQYGLIGTRQKYSQTSARGLRRLRSNQHRNDCLANYAETWRLLPPLFIRGYLPIP